MAYISCRIIASNVTAFFDFQLKPLSPNLLTPVPEGIRDYVKMLLQPDIDIRPDAHEILKVRKNKK